MNTRMDTLVNIAIIGTGQMPTTSLSSELPIAAIADQLATQDSEHQLLLSAGIMSVYHRAGYAPASFPQQLAGTEPEELRPCPADLESPLTQVFQETSGPVFLETLHLMRDAQILLSPRLLPLALNIGHSHEDYHSLIYPLLGKRGLWLSQFQTNWAWTRRYEELRRGIHTGDMEKFWLGGTQAERKEALRQQRQTDPAGARARLAGVWRQESAEVRKDFLDMLRINLSLDDEEFLEKALDDRSPEVQKRAAWLLGLLPVSAFNKRMYARVKKLLSFQNDHFQITLPEITDAFWKHDGLEVTPPNSQQNPNHEIISILAHVPLTFWEEHFARTPEQLLAALGDGEKDQMVLLGWCEAARHFSNSNWYMPLWHKYYQAGPAGSLSPWQRQFWLSLVKHSQQEGEALITYSIEQGQEWADLVKVLPAPWSQPFSDFFLQKLNEFLQDEQPIDFYRSPWPDALAEVARAIAPESIPFALESSQKKVSNSTSEYYWNRRNREFRNILHLRQQIRKGINA